jgi:hypothetical protein
MSCLWIFVSKFSNNLFRDSLLWDMVYVVVFSIVLIYFGYGSKYELKHWVGVFMTVGVFIYWLVIK